jgi:hypothetical protein
LHWILLMLLSHTLQVRINKASKVIPLRDIIDLTNTDGPEFDKEWQYSFTVVTKDREYFLFAQTRDDKEMWMHAFNTILKYKHKAAEDK